MGNTSCGERVACVSYCEEKQIKRDGKRHIVNLMRTLLKPEFDVEVAVSPLVGMKGLAGYHSSVMVAGEEYFFSPMGIIHSPRLASHKQNPETQVFHMGFSRFSGQDLMDFLDQYFPMGHYDLLRKNCNCFSDCALYFLCEQRLDWTYRKVEHLGKLADDHAGIIQSISAGDYTPNPRAVGFDLEATIDEIKARSDAFEVDVGFVGDAEIEEEIRPECNHPQLFASGALFSFPEKQQQSEVSPRIYKEGFGAEA